MTGLLILLGGIFYFLPSFIAKRNKKKNIESIMALNLFAGWSIIGWVIALVWALNKDNDTHIFQKHSDADELQKLADLKNQGILSEEEFQMKKQKLMNN